MMKLTGMRANVLSNTSLSSSGRPLRRAVVPHASLKVGDKAPTFSLKNQNGKTVSVKYGGSFIGGKPTVVFFYPKDNTPGCTREAKAFEDAYAQIGKIATVYGISSDDPESHSNFCSSLGLSYTLLSDEDGSVREKFGVPKDLFGLLPGRETYVIGKDGTILGVFNNQFDPEKHVQFVLKTLEA